MQNVTNQTYKLKTDSQNKKLSFSYFSNLTLHCLDAKKVNKPKKHAKHLIHAQSYKMNSKKVVWYSTVKVVNTFMSWISKITIILDKMLQVFMRTSQITFSRPSRATELSKIVFLNFAHAKCTDFHVPTSRLPSSFSDCKVRNWFSRRFPLLKHPVFQWTLKLYLPHSSTDRSDHVVFLIG